MHTPTDSSEFTPSDETAQQIARQVLARFQRQKGNLLPILHAIQHVLGCIPASAVPVLAEGLRLSRAEIHGVISFYPHFREKAPAPIVLEICRAESCQAMGSEALTQHVRERLGCDFHGESRDRSVSLEPVYCLGLCAQSPAVMINGQPHARITPQKLETLLKAEGWAA